MNHKTIKNAITVDVEDYYQVSAFERDVSRSDWDSIESRVEKNTDSILEVFNERNVKGTFFVLGWIAERHPKLVERIYKEGHEVACHGYSHKLIYKQNIKEFQEETLKAKHILEDIIQDDVLGYRAASYSITNDSLWALDILSEAGFKYDSSIYPVLHDRYGIPGSKEQPHIITGPSGTNLIEFPLSVYQFFRYRLPISGGGYFRLYPYAFTKFALSSLNKEGCPFIFYLHPWEVDPDQPRISTNLLSKFRHYNNLSVCKDRLIKLVNDFHFDRVDNVLRTSGFDI